MEDLYGVCAFDNPNNRTLTGHYESSEQRTIEKCLSICRNDENWYPYAGLEWQSECFCGEEPDVGFIWSWPDKCDERCSGDSQQNCGGANAISIWRTSPGYINGECFFDYSSPRRVFEDGFSIDGLNDLTVQICIDICKNTGMDMIF